MAFRFWVKLWKGFSTPRLLHKFFPCAEDTLAGWGPWGSRSGKMRAAEKDYGEGLQTSSRWIIIWDLDCQFKGKAAKQNRFGCCSLPSGSISCNKFPQIPWSPLTENGWPHSMWERYTPSLSKAAIKNILLSAGDQVAHLGRWHTWVNRLPHPSCAR